MIRLDDVEVAVRQHLTRSFVEHGRAPSNAELASAFPGVDIERVLQSLASKKALVLHPHRVEPWVVHPFSAAPTAMWVEGATRGWWAPCAWCALGIAALAGDVRIVGRYGGEGEPVEVRVRDNLVEGDAVVHFPIAVARLWDSVHYACSVMLFHRSTAAVDAWCARHAIARGAVVSLAQSWDLARAWYGPYLDAGWNRKSGDEVEALFRSVGLGMDFQPL